MLRNVAGHLRRWLYRRTVRVKSPDLPTLSEVQSDDLFFVPPTLDLEYQATFGFADYLNAQHAAWASWPLNADRILQHPIFGWLRRADALKLYEMAALCQGDVLELGTHQGLSTHIMAAAVEAFGGGRRIESFDLDPDCVAKARANLSLEIAKGLVSIEVGEASAQCRRFIGEGRRYGFVFVDHSHYYGPMYEICRLMPAVIQPGGFVLFHDFTDPRSRSPVDGEPEPDFGVLAACHDCLPPGSFQYLGAFGCSGLFRRNKRE
jgi:Methyltransferase domain